MTTSAIYAGHVAHNRPGKHRLKYSIFMLALDVDEIDAIGDRLKLFSHNRFNLFSLFDRDHADRRDEPIAPRVEAKLRQAGIVWDGGRIVLLTMPRLLNYVFNPLSVYFCYRCDGELAALVHEVSNTFGEHHYYVLPASVGKDGYVRQSCDKAFFVSPFLEMGLRYEFVVTPLCEKCRITMVVRGVEGVALTASFNGGYRTLSDINLVRAWAGNPLMTFKVIAGIHWEALKMCFKGVPYLGRNVRSEAR